MTAPMEHDWPPTMRPRRGRRQPSTPVLDGEVLTQQEEQPRIRVEIVRRYVPRRQRSAPPAWLIVLVTLAVVMWMAPLGTVIAIVMLSIFLTEHPAIAVMIGAIIAALIVAAIRERWHGRPF